MDAATGLIGLAGAGAQIVSALYKYGETAYHANDDIPELAGHITLTSNVLKSVGNALKQKEFIALISGDALQQVDDVKERCNSIFQDISASLEKRQKVKADGSVDVSFRGNLVWAFKADRVEKQKRKLEGLKTDLLILLNVLQLASKSASTPNTEARPIESPEAEAIRILMTKKSSVDRAPRGSSGASSEMLRDTASSQMSSAVSTMKPGDVTMNEHPPPIRASSTEAFNTHTIILNGAGTSAFTSPSDPPITEEYTPITLFQRELNNCSELIEDFVSKICEAQETLGRDASPRSATDVQSNVRKEFYKTSHAVRKILNTPIVETRYMTMKTSEDEEFGGASFNHEMELNRVSDLTKLLSPAGRRQLKTVRSPPSVPPYVPANPLRVFDDDTQASPESTPILEGETWDQGLEPDTDPIADLVFKLTNLTEFDGKTRPAKD